MVLNLLYSILYVHFRVKWLNEYEYTLQPLHSTPAVTFNTVLSLISGRRRRQKEKRRKEKQIEGEDDEQQEEDRDMARSGDVRTLKFKERRGLQILQ